MWEVALSWFDCPVRFLAFIWFCNITFRSNIIIRVDFCFWQLYLFFLPLSLLGKKKLDICSLRTLLCDKWRYRPGEARLSSGGFPSAWSLGWKVGGSSSSSGVSHSLEVLGRDGHYSRSSSLSLSADQWRKAGSVSCEASLNGQSPVTQSLEPERCSE